MSRRRKTDERLLHVEEEILHKLEEIEHDLHSHTITGFAPIHQENNMVLLAAGQTATFATTPIPATSTPVPASILWTSSDATAFPLTPNTADATGLSTLLTFPESTVAGETFSLTVEYTNADGTIATETTSFVTVAPPVADVTGFTPIVQTA